MDKAVSPSREGLGYTMLYGGQAAAIGFGIGVAIGPRLFPTRTVPVKGVDAPKASEITNRNQYVVRGGKNPVQKLQDAMPEISAASAPGKSPSELAAGIPTRSGVPYSEYSYTTVGEINDIGGTVYAQRLSGYPTHCYIVCTSGNPETFATMLREILRQGP